MTNRLKGSIPNVSWRSIPHDDLQYHPSYSSLPPLCLLLKDSVKLNQILLSEDHPIYSMVDNNQDKEKLKQAYKNHLYVNKIKQHSSAWQLLHTGRITSSNLSSLLGFTENKVASLLKVPAALHGHDTFMQSWNILKGKEKNLWNLDIEKEFKCSMNECVCQISTNNSSEYDIFNEWNKYKEELSKKIWKINLNYNQLNKENFNGNYLYNYFPSSSTLSTSNSLSSSSISYSKNSNKKKGKSVNLRLNWGTYQESTATLSLLNYLIKHNRGKLEEVGLLTIENIINSKDFILNNEFNFIYPTDFLFSSSPSTSDPLSSIEQREDLTKALYKTIANELNQKNLPPLGVSPDGLIKLPNGELVAVEIKTHSPFYELNTGEFEIILQDYILSPSSSSPTSTSPTSSSTTSTRNSSIVPWHLPQLQLEMLCSGVNCKSLIYVLYTLDSVSIYEIERNDEVICFCFYFLLF